MEYGLSFVRDKESQAVFLDELAKTGSIAEAAKSPNVGRSVPTVYRAIRLNPDLKAGVKQAQAEYRSRMAREFREYAPEALETLLSVIRDNKAPATSKVNAAKAIIDYSNDWGEAEEMENRIEALKAEIAKAETELKGDAL